MIPSQVPPRSRSSTPLRLAGAVALASWMLAAAPQDCPEADLDGNGVVDEADLEIVRGQVGRRCEPRILSVSPASGAASRSTTIVVEGVGLGMATSVTIGGEPAASVEAVAPGTIRVVVGPSITTGAKELVVTTAGGTASVAGAFRHVGTDLAWAEILEVAPDPRVVSDPDLRAAIVATGLPWRVRDLASGVEMLVVPPATFTMGAAADDPQAFPADGPPHAVTLSRPFYLGRSELTQAQWRQMGGVVGSGDAGGSVASATLPACEISWFDATAVIARHGLRLPTEAEWEHACRAGGDADVEEISAVAWHWPISGGALQEVATKQPNALGLYDMLGNAFEWVEDWHGPYAAEARTDPRGPAEGEARVVRGGSAFFGKLCRPTRRYEFEPQTRRLDVGVRVARDP